MQSSVELIADSLSHLRSGRIMVITGAGVSLASGIPTFRGTDPDAVWEQEVLEVATCRFFERDPVRWWQWILGLVQRAAPAKPNPAHYALAALERWHLERGGSFLLVTQNIDTLHENAGSRQLAKVHGSADRLRCSEYGCPNGSPNGSLPFSDFDLNSFLRDPQHKNLPRCPRCNSLLRVHALLFDELYTEHADYQFERVRQEAELAQIALFVGTSFSVGITDLILKAALLRRIPVISIDPAANALADYPGIQQIPAQAEVLLPSVCGQLGIPLV